jgi:hypothetical protein
MKKLLAIMFTIMLAFAPMVTAEPTLTKEALIIPVEDLGSFIQLFKILNDYDTLLNDAMSNYFSINDFLRTKINEKMANDELSKEDLELFTYYFSSISTIDGTTFDRYMGILNDYRNSGEVSGEILALVLNYLEE